jgi:hypothetical protein
MRLILCIVFCSSGGAESIGQENELLNTLRDAILDGTVTKNTDVLEAADGISFPVVVPTSVVFIRQFYITFYNHFHDIIMPSGPGVIFRGPPGIGKVGILKSLTVG